jgi:hypothetical protein
VHVNSEDLDQQIAEARAQNASPQERLAYLLKVAAGPRVPVLGHFWHRFSERTEECETFELAVSMLDCMADNGSCSPIGVSVNGGQIIPFNEACERWGSRELADV